MLATALLLLTGCLTLDEDGGPLPLDERPPLDEDTGFAEEVDEEVDEQVDEEDPPEDTEPEAIIAEACHPDLEGWADSWEAWEAKVVELINAERAAGANCGTYGNFPPAGPVVMDDNLRCAARYHSLWMAQTDSFSHDSPGGDLGDDPWERIDSTDFAGSAVGENIAAGYSSPASVVAGWMDSDGHCSNLMNDDATLTGVGYYQGGSYGHYWTQNFGR